MAHHRAGNWQVCVRGHGLISHSLSLARAASAGGGIFFGGERIERPSARDSEESGRLRVGVGCVRVWASAVGVSAALCTSADLCAALYVSLHAHFHARTRVRTDMPTHAPAVHAATEQRRHSP